ncbi:MAG: methyltransferase domain-containing protein [Acidimicrobiia bacterium]|nr:methyltransferase domain-containing protein [Acidimicrobiia bacterium]
MNDRYTHGHHESVLRSHRWRTAENSAGYLLAHLEPGQQLLDVGCGPGTITLDLAGRVAPGVVVGVDVDADVIDQASTEAVAAGVANVRFLVGDGYALDFGDGEFDVVHAHQVLQHVSDPVRALTEMRRVLRPGGVLAVRDSDYHAFAWSPRDPLLDRWLELYTAVTRRNGAECDAGRFLKRWVAAAGFVDVAFSSSTWTYASAEDRSWWGEVWADRVRDSSYGVQAVEYGLSDAAELASISDAWRRWSRADDGVFIVVHGEALATAP